MFAAHAGKGGTERPRFGALLRRGRRDSQAAPANEAGDEFTGLEAVVKEVVRAHPRWLKGDGEGLRRKQDINATNRGRTGEPSPDELVQRITASGGPEEVKAKVREYVANGCTCPILYPLGDPYLMIEVFSDGYSE